MGVFRWVFWVGFLMPTLPQGRTGVPQVPRPRPQEASAQEEQCKRQVWLFPHQRRVRGAVHSQEQCQVRPALLLRGRDRSSEAEERGGGGVGPGLPQVLLQGPGDSE